MPIVKRSVVCVLLLALAALGGCSGSPGVSTQPVGSAQPVGSDTPNLHLAFVGRPYDTVAGARMRPGVRVAILDASNRVVDTAQTVVTLSAADGRASLGGRLQVAARHGVAHFDEIVQPLAGQKFALVASADGLPSVTSRTFRVVEARSGIKSIHVAPASPSLPVGRTQALTVTGVSARGGQTDVTAQVTWSSSDPSKAAVAATGAVSGKALGTATITARLGDLADTVPVVVTTATLLSIAVTQPPVVAPSPAVVPRLMQTPLRAVGTFSDGSTRDVTADVTWRSSNVQIAAVSDEGLVTGAEVGNATVTALDPSGIQGFLAVDVTPSGSAGPSFSTYLGGKTAFSGRDPFTFAENCAVDAGGNTYVTGATAASDLATADAYQAQPAENSQVSAFVAKYSPTGEVVWCTYLGGDQQTVGVGVAATPTGGVAVTGWTSSVNDFPLWHACQAAYGGGTADAFLTVFDGDGTLLYSTYLGGNQAEGPGFADNDSAGNNVAVDGNGLVYVTGETAAPMTTPASTGFPITPNALEPTINKGFTTHPGATDAYLCIFDPSQAGVASLLYSSYLGGAKDEKGHAIAVDAAGQHVALVGYTSSGDLPTLHAFQAAPTTAFTSNGFVAQFHCSSPGNPSYRYVSYLGSPGTRGGGPTEVPRDDAYAVALTATGKIMVTGRTESMYFPVTSSTAIFNQAPAGTTPGTSGDEPYLVEIDPSQAGTNSFLYGTLLGGADPTVTQRGAWGTAIALAPDGTAWVGGEVLNSGTQYTTTPPPQTAPTLFPYTPEAFFTALQCPLGTPNCMLMQVTASGATLGYSTYFGGSVADRTYGLAVDSAGYLHWSGLTQSPNFPTRNAAQQWPQWPGPGAPRNAFVTKFGPW